MKLLNFEVWFYIYVVSWTKALRYRPNREQCRESEQFRGKDLRDPGHGRFRDTCSMGRGKDKEMLKAVLVETPVRTNAKGVQYELRRESVRMQMPKTRVVELLAL